MKKHLIISIIATVFLGATGFAEARDHQRGYSKPHHSYGQNRHYGYNRYSRNRHYDRNYGRHYGRHYPHHYRGHSSRHHLRDGLKVAAGALLIGSIIHAASNNKRERVVVHRRTAPARSSDYWYRIDNEGQCVEVRLNREGQEVWTYVDRSYCE